ncbi:hypothetical protein PQG22_08415 [Aquirufa beregesia]
MKIIQRDSIHTMHLKPKKLDSPAVQYVPKNHSETSSGDLSSFDYP